jgi:hypothetical protein
MIGQVMAVQKTYGKSAADLETIVEGYCRFLQTFSMIEIESALEKYILSHDDLPSPSSIAQIIDPSLAPLSNSVYIEVCAKIRAGTTYVTDAERAFKNRYEANEFKKVGVSD